MRKYIIVAPGSKMLHELIMISIFRYLIYIIIQYYFQKLRHYLPSPNICTQYPPQNGCQCIRLKKDVYTCIACIISPCSQDISFRHWKIHIGTKGYWAKVLIIKSELIKKSEVSSKKRRLTNKPNDSADERVKVAALARHNGFLLD